MHWLDGVATGRSPEAWPHAALHTNAERHVPDRVPGEPSRWPPRVDPWPRLSVVRPQWPDALHGRLCGGRHADAHGRGAGARASRRAGASRAHRGDGAGRGAIPIARTAAGSGHFIVRQPGHPGTCWAWTPPRWWSAASTCWRSGASRRPREAVADSLRASADLGSAWLATFRVPHTRRGRALHRGALDAGARARGRRHLARLLHRRHRAAPRRTGDPLSSTSTSSSAWPPAPRSWRPSTARWRRSRIRCRTT